MTIRRQPADFVVVERPSAAYLAAMRAGRATDAPHAVYELTKESLGTPEAIHQFAREVGARGAIPFVHPNLPFGGVNNSGIGKAHGHYGFMAFSNERSVVHQRRGITSFKLIYPPYTTKVKQTIQLVMKYL